ncbi:MAG: hypothetical protein Q8R24_03155 [Legionellaceae bacterium]|nr:hypothetical protein [Legionellaceae bacterium]
MLIQPQAIQENPVPVTQERPVTVIQDEPVKKNPVEMISSSTQTDIPNTINSTAPQVNLTRKFFELIYSPLSFAFFVSTWAGTITGSVVTLLIASPGIALDQFIETDESHTLKTFRFLEGKTTLYEGGFFSKYPGIAGEVIGGVVNMTTTISTGIALTAVAVALIASALALSLAIAIVAVLIVSVRCCIAGPQQTAQEFGFA